MKNSIVNAIMQKLATKKTITVLKSDIVIINEFKIVDKKIIQQDTPSTSISSISTIIV